MHIISMLLLPVSFLLAGVLCASSAEGSARTYERIDPVTGRTLQCEMCPPGQHMTAHCTATAQTQCADCKSDHYTELWNYLNRCLYCNNFCTENQEVEQECTATSNRVCRCKEGFYWANDYCIPHTKCGPGHGVQTKGTAAADTQCENCADGSFSSSSSAVDPCVNHQTCETGQTVLFSGSVYHDTVCGTCQDLENGGVTHRNFLSGFLSTMRVPKMKRFVTRFINKSREERRARDLGHHRQRGPLMEQIRTWLAAAPQEELRKMPELLKGAKFRDVGDHLQRQIEEIQLSANCTLNN